MTEPEELAKLITDRRLNVAPVLWLLREISVMTETIRAEVLEEAAKWIDDRPEQIHAVVLYSASHPRPQGAQGESK